MAARSLSLMVNFDDSRKARVYRREIDPLASYTENELRSRYRFGKEGIKFIVDLLADEISPSTRRSHSLSATEQVLITLRLLASGSFLEVTFLSYDKSTVSRVIRRVTKALAAKVNDFVKFPATRNERDEVKRGLFRIGGFPCSIGCIDGTLTRRFVPKDGSYPDDSYPTRTICTQTI